MFTFKFNGAYLHGDRHATSQPFVQPMKSIICSRLGAKLVRSALFVIISAVLGGCGTGRWTVSLPLPAATFTTAAVNKSAFVESVSDRRTFTDKPNDPSVPSPKDPVSKLTPDQRKQVIGRVQNGFGQAMSDIFLNGNVTIEDLTRQLIKNGLASAGYKVSETANVASSDVVHVRVMVREFWCTWRPGVAASTIEARITTYVEIENSGKRVTMQVRGYGRNKVVMAAAERNWQQTWQRCFDDYMLKLEAALFENGLSTQ